MHHEWPYNQLASYSDYTSLNDDIILISYKALVHTFCYVSHQQTLHIIIFINILESCTAKTPLRIPSFIILKTPVL